MTDDSVRAGFAGTLKPIAQEYINPYWTEDVGTLDGTLELVRILTLILVNKLMVSPRSQKVVVLEQPMWPVKVKKAIAHALLAELHVSGLVFLPSAVCSVIGAQARDGLVVNVGWFDTIVVPVYDMRQLVVNTGVTRGIAKVYLHEKESDHRETNFRMTKQQLNMIRDSAFDGSWAASQLLEPQDHPDDNELCIPSLIEKVFANLDLTCRQACLQNIVVTGPFASVPGLASRVLQRVQTKWPTARVVIGHGPWAGSSVHASCISWPLTGRLKGELSLERYLANESKILFEWTFEM